MRVILVLAILGALAGCGDVPGQGEPATAPVEHWIIPGTHPAANYLGIGDALTFHQGIGSERKTARLVHLRDYWANRLMAFSDRVYLNTSQMPGKAAGIANVGVEGLDTGQLNSWLWREHKIISVGINHAEFTGLRISPSVFTTHEELDRFCGAIESAITHGITA